MNFSESKFLVLEDSRLDQLILTNLMLEIGIHEDQIHYSSSIAGIPAQNYDYILSDLNIEDSFKLETVHRIQKMFPHAIIIVLSGMDNTELATEAIHAGAQDYLIKGETNALELKKTLLFAKERQDLSNQLKHSEIKFRNLIEHTFDGIIILDQQYKISYASPSIFSLMGFFPDELVGNKLEDLVARIDLSDFREAMKILHDQIKKVYRIKMRICKKDNSHFWIEASISDQRNTPGINGFVFNFKDMDPEAIAQEKLQASEKKLIDVTNAIPGAVFSFRLTKHLEFQLEFMSQGIEIITGLKPESYQENLLEYMKKRLDDHTFKCLFSKVKESARNLTSFELEYSAKHINGMTKWVKIQAKPSLDIADNSILWNGIVTDVTETVKTRFEKEQLANVLQKSRNEIYLFDIESLKFEYVNLEALSNLGYSSEQMRYLTPVQILPEFDSVSFKTLLNPLIRQKQEKIIVETKHQRANGTTYPIEAHVQLVRNSQKPVFAAFIIDITERVEYVREIEDQNKRLEKIAYTQSHSVRGPLARMKGLINIIDCKAYQDDTELNNILQLITASYYELDQITRKIVQQTQVISQNTNDVKNEFAESK